MLIPTLCYGTISTIAKMVDHECRVKYEMIETLGKKLQTVNGDDVIGNFIIGFKAGARAQLKINIYNYRACLDLFDTIKDQADSLEESHLEFIRATDTLKNDKAAMDNLAAIVNNVGIINNFGDLAKRSQERMRKLGL